MTPMPKKKPKRNEVGPALASFLPFGPEFFARHLARFVRERCPDEEAGLARVYVHLGGGETLDLCRVVELGPSWAALEVRDEDEVGDTRTELVPYELIRRVTIRPPRDP